MLVKIMKLFYLCRGIVITVRQKSLLSRTHIRPNYVFGYTGFYLIQDQTPVTANLPVCAVPAVRRFVTNGGCIVGFCHATPGLPLQWF